MNNIQRALTMQNIHVAWFGDEPEHYNKITKAYMADNINGVPRMIRTSEDAGKHVVITKLKTDYRTTVEAEQETLRVNAITDAADNLIISNISAEDQANMVMESIIIINSGEETDRLTQIVEQMQWILSVKQLAKDTITDGTELEYIEWPKFPK